MQIGISMHFLDLTLERPVDNIAVDEALLEQAESGQGSELLRLWEPSNPMVVLGRSSSIRHEVKLDICDARNIPVFRRCSGGATIITDTDCLMYSVLLDYRLRPHLRMLEQAHLFVMQRMHAAIQNLGFPVEICGTCDLALNNRKFSGNALRCKRNWMMYHGTILCENFDLNLVSECLGTPKRQPEYRRDREHHEFLTTLPASPQTVRSAIIQQWRAEEILVRWPERLTTELSDHKYLTEAWTHKI